MILDILFWFTLLYALQIMLYAAAAWRARYPSNRSFLPRVSVIVAARNEESNIGKCLESMVQLTYPRNLLEVIIIDDHSVDETQAIVNRYAREYAFISVVTSGPETSNLRGKTNAVTHGIESSTGEILLFTDADCTVPEHWVEETVKYYTDPGVGVVAGFTSLVADGWFGFMQALDWFFLFSVAAATVRLRYPVTAVGNNLSVRRAAYDAVGGYRKIPFSVTEDYALFHAITSGTRYVARFPMDRAALVRSTSCKTWHDLYHQKKRWFTGGRGMDIKSMLVFALSYILNVLLVAGVIFFRSAAVWSAVGIKLAVDILLCLPAVSRFRRWNLLLYFPIFELYYLFYVLYYPPLVLFSGSIVWKERAFGAVPAK